MTRDILLHLRYLTAFENMKERLHVLSRDYTRWCWRSLLGGFYKHRLTKIKGMWNFQVFFLIIHLIYAGWLFCSIFLNWNINKAWPTTSKQSWAQLKKNHRNILKGNELIMQWGRCDTIQGIIPPNLSRDIQRFFRDLISAIFHFY